MRIFHKLLLGFFIITLLIWSVGFFAVRTFRQTREKTIAAYSVSFAGMILKSLDQEIFSDFLRIKIRSLGNTLQQTVLASNKVFEGMADREGYINRADQEWIATSGDKVTPFMQQILDLPLSRSFLREQDFYRERYGYVLLPEIFVTNRFGAVVGASNKTSDYRQNDEDWWQEAWQKGFYFSPVEFDASSKTYSIAIAARVEDDRHNSIGVFKGILDSREIVELLKNCEKDMVYKTGHLFLFDSNGRYIFPPEKFGKVAEPSLKAYLSSAHARDESTFEIIKNDAGHPMFFVYKRSLGFEEYSGGGLVLLASYDGREIFEPTNRVGAFVFIATAIATVFSFLIGLFIAASFSRPLEKLRRAADRLGNGDFESKVGITSKDEFGIVARDLELMAESLKKKTTSIERLDKEIEERKLLEKVSLENSLFLQKMMDSIPSPVFYKDISGVYIGCNRAFESFFGIPQKNLRGKKVAELFPPEVAQVYQDKDADLFSLPGIQVYEASVRNANGELRDIVFHKATFSGPSGEVQGLIGVIMDITLRKQAEAQLRESHALYEQVVSNITDIIWRYEVDAQGQFVSSYISPVADRLLGLPAGTLGDSFEKYFSYVHSDDIPGVLAMFSTGLRERQKVVALDYRLLKADGSMIWAHSTGSSFEGRGGGAIGFGTTADITDRKLAESLLQESEKRFMDVLYAAQDAILLIDGETFVDCNEATARMLGYPTRQEFMMSHPSKLSPPSQPDGRDSFEKANDMMKIAFTEGFHRFEWIHRKADGEDFPVEVSLTPVSIHGKNMLHCLWRDMTEIKKIEKAIRESEMRYRTLVGNLPGVVYRCRNDQGWTMEYVSEEMLRLTGYPASDFVNNNVRAYASVIHPDDQKKVADAVQAGLLTQQPYVVEYRVVNADGEIKWVYEKGQGVRSSDGSAPFRDGAIFDMTEERSAEIQVRQLSQAVEQSPSCVVITDKEGRIEYVNQKFTELTGYSQNEVFGKNPRILKSGEQSAEFYKDLWDTILHGKDWQGQLCNKKKSGELYWEHAHIAPIRDEKGDISHFVAVKEDITYRRQIEEQLRHSLRMEAVGRLAGGIAHDFNNMLTVINGYSGYLLGKMNPEDPNYDKVREIRDAGDCAASVVRQLLNLSRKEAPKPQLIRVSEVAGKMERMIKRLLKDDVEFKVEHAEQTGFVKLDPGQMEQVLLNLLVNAREAMPAGGTLTVTTDCVRIEDIQEELMPSRKREGDFVRITVKDTGDGIDPSLKTRVFEPFFTTKKKGMNTGLGLSIVCGIVEQAGGAMSFESQLGKGTIFRVYLPRVEGPEDFQGGPSEVLPLGRGKILLVEDENQVREFALQVLRERGYDVRVARGGEEALAMLAEDPGRAIDLLLTDLTMPKMNGKELALRIRQTIPNLKVIFMSGYSEQMVADMDGTEFLQKPFGHGQLSVKVWSVLGR